MKLTSSPECSEPLDREAQTILNHVSKLRLGNPERRLWYDWLRSLNFIGTNCNEYQHDHCWGTTILRTSYGDDEKFARGVDAVARLVVVPIEIDHEEHDAPDGPEVDEDTRMSWQRDTWFKEGGFRKAWNDMIRRAKAAAPEGQRCTADWILTHHLLGRYHNFVVEDKEALDGADARAAWRYYHDKGCNDRESGLRCSWFVLMDEESIERLSRAPSREEMALKTPEERARIAWDHMIKVVDTGCAADEDGEDVDDISACPGARKWMRLFDFLDIYLFMQHNGGICEIGVEGYNREGYVKYEGEVDENGFREREWEICKNPEQPSMSMYYDWLTEVYGPEKR